ncbi:class I SAM-dependent methyltransferase [Pseudooceanicola sp. LIPI14-2-Ac024]|uniref:class I SAM-dependent methyltransferase n=1 Tax=Pseudooceanicola sp. LIPI14-2-Ac024 TaxID=3344875 RepID=UPI0035CF0233
MTITETDEAGPAATMWGLGGEKYDLVSFAISDALAHAAQRLDPAPGSRVLDVATGTGWSARNAARYGAHVTACDFAPGMLTAARALSAGVQPAIEFHQASAEALPFEDAAFDGVISTFGVMFAADPARAAAELARVVRPGGRLALATWVPGGSVAEFFAMLAAFSDAPPPPSNPMDWGEPDRLQALLGGAFVLEFEPGVSHARHADEAAIWAWYLAGFGPVKLLHDALGPDDRARLRTAFDAFHAHYRTPSGRLDVTRDYLVTIGTRR